MMICSRTPQSRYSWHLMHLVLKKIKMVYPSLPLASSMIDKTQPVQEPGELYHHSLPLLVGFQVEEVAWVVHQVVGVVEVGHQMGAVEQ